MDNKSNKKRKLILEKAKQLFIEKGYNAVTMKDIIWECNISRGGIYLYFKSVAEIFMEVIYAHNDQKLKETRTYIAEDKDFKILIDEYFEKHKKRLLNINNSLVFATYEYRFAHKEDYDKEFFNNQFLNTKTIILEMLNYGAKKGHISNHNIEDLAMSIMFFIEGISMLGTASDVSEQLVDNQIEFIKQMILNYNYTK